MEYSKKIQLGDVFQLNTNKGRVMLQYVYFGSVEFIKVYRTFYFDLPNELETFMKESEYFILQFPIKAAHKMKIIEKVGNAKFKFMLPEFMKHRSFNKDGIKGWTIVNTKTYRLRFTEFLTEEEKYLSPFGVWNDTLLISRLENDWQLWD